TSCGAYTILRGVSPLQIEGFFTTLLGCRGLTGSSACRKPPPFKLDRTEVPKSRVAASSVIEHLDVVEDSGSKLHPCHPSLPVEKFCLQRSEETLCHRIVVGVSDGSHRTYKPSFTQGFSKGKRGVL